MVEKLESDKRTAANGEAVCASDITSEFKTSYLRSERKIKTIEIGSPLAENANWPPSSLAKVTICNILYKF